MGCGLSARYPNPAFIALLVVLCHPAWAQNVYPSIVADAIYGQTTYNTPSPSPLPDMKIYRGSGIAATEEGVYISDATYNRIMFFPHGSSTATRVYGQPDFLTTAPNYGGVSARSLSEPLRLAADASGLYVADYGNNRVLHYPPGSTVADRVYGQSGFNTNTVNQGGISASSLNRPSGVALDPDGALFICDSGNNRVLYYPPGETTATFVYGQPGFTNSGMSMAKDRMYQPSGLAVDETGIYVSEWFANRVKFFPRDVNAATRVYGQPDFNSIIPNAFGMGPRSLQRPVDCAADEHGLYVAEYLNSRVIFFPQGSTTATVVYGQPDFHTLGLNQYGVSQFGVYVTQRVAVSATKVYIADYQSRVLRFPKVLTPIPAEAHFAATPTEVAAGEPFPTPPVVQVRGADGSLSSGFNGPVTVRLRSGEGLDKARLVGEATVLAADGVAVFPDLSISAPGTYHLEALTLSLPVGVSPPIRVAASPADVARADLDRDGAFTLADVILHLRVAGGLEVMP